MALIEMKTATITEKGQISIPSEIRKIKGFKEGKKIVILAFNDRIEIIPLEDWYERMSPALLSEKSFAKDWLSKEEDEAWKDL